MDIFYFYQIAGAVIIGNAFSFAFFMGAMKCSQLQKNGVKDDQLPWWVYLCLAAAPFFLLLVFLSVDA